MSRESRAVNIPMARKNIVDFYLYQLNQLIYAFMTYRLFCQHVNGLRPGKIEMNAVSL
jgi:hypothetical protein